MKTDVFLHGDIWIPQFMIPGNHYDLAWFPPLNELIKENFCEFKLI